MSRILVAYFSASGVTKGLAKKLAEAVGADIFEIVPETPYTEADLDWRNADSRSSVEMKNPAYRPAVAKFPENLDYDMILVGFPIWWYVAPTIVNTFLEGCDLAGKKVVPFATSGGSGMGDTNKHLAASCGGAQLLEGRLFKPSASKQELADWAAEL